MKVPPSRLGAFLANPGACRVVLLFGDDVGMIRERAETLVRGVAGSLDNPFLVTELAREAPDQLIAEANSLPLTGDRRIVRVREATDAVVGAVQILLKSDARALVVLEAPSIAARSKLRAVLEAAPDGVAIGCYPVEGRALEEIIRGALEDAGVTIHRDALNWLGSQLGADQVSTRVELERLALYAGPGGSVDLETAIACVGDLSGLSMDDSLSAVTEGDMTTADRALELAFAEGAAPVAVLRAGLMHVQRLYRARLQVDLGVDFEDAIRTARPPVFFRRIPAFAKALTIWSTSALSAAMIGLSQAERTAKLTGAPDVTISRHSVLILATCPKGAILTTESPHQ